MKPIRVASSNFTFTAPPGMPECQPLPCQRLEDGRIISVWEFTPEERKQVADGANIQFQLYSRSQPPVGFGLTDEQETK